MDSAIAIFAAGDREEEIIALKKMVEAIINRK